MQFRLLYYERLLASSMGKTRPDKQRFVKAYSMRFDHSLNPAQPRMPVATMKATVAVVYA